MTNPSEAMIEAGIAEWKAVTADGVYEYEPILTRIFTAMQQAATPAAPACPAGFDPCICPDAVAQDDDAEQLRADAAWLRKRTCDDAINRSYQRIADALERYAARLFPDRVTPAAPVQDADAERAVEAALILRAKGYSEHAEALERIASRLTPDRVTPAAPVQDDDAELIARLFHEAYERLAPQFSYETRKASAKPWDEVPENNRKLMIAVAAEVKARLTHDRVTPLVEALRKLNVCGSCGGSGRYPDKGWRDGTFIVREVECKKCDGTGENLIARAALRNGGFDA